MPKTVAPSLDSSRAVSAPSPDDAPVTSTILSCSANVRSLDSLYPLAVNALWRNAERHISVLAVSGVASDGSAR